jgi:hypothetical protein
MRVRALSALACALLLGTLPPPVSAIQSAAPAAQSPSSAGQSPSFGARTIYEQTRALTLSGAAADVSNLVLKRDRVAMTFTGTFYFAAPVDGRVTGAVFVGQGTMRAEVPASEFEKENVRRLLQADLVESDFKTAVLRWSDDTLDLIAAGKRDGVTVPAQATELAGAFEDKFAIETGANIGARVALSVLNKETPGVFVAQFDGGRRNRFTYVLDHQGRIPVGNFSLNGGEKGVIFQHQSALYFNEVWLAFYAENDYAKGIVEYSDAHDLIDVKHYGIRLDLRDLTKTINLVASIEMTVRGKDVRAVPFNIGESLSASQRERLVRQLRLKRVRMGDMELAWAQADWEGGFMVFLPQAAQAGEAVTIQIELDGDFMQSVPVVPECYYPRNNVTWLPRHGYLDRATFDMTFRHRKRDRVASGGTRVSEAVDPDDPQAMITRYRMAQPIALAVFAVGPFDRKTQQVTWEAGGKPIPLEFNSVPSRVTAIKHEFILAELDNAVRYFAALFGPYPYDTFGAAFHPYGFGQGFASLLMIPPTDQENKYTHAFIAHETAHQWWGNIVSWRSYRDQWLSEGFAEYSGLLYAGKRDREGPKAAADLIRELRESLRNQPRTATGLAGGRLNDIGPVIQGLRLNTTKTLGAYQALVYNKGALVLRMLHFLFSNPSTYDDTAFNTMMQDFVGQYRNRAARTEDFWAVASKHFPNTPTAQKFGLRDLNWFFRQWVYGTGLPTYQLDYEVVTKPEGMFVTGTVKQDGVPADWQMVLPLVMSFDGGQEARTTVAAAGASTPFTLKVPMKPRKVELDPYSWILSERTTSKGK